MTTCTSTRNSMLLVVCAMSATGLMLTSCTINIGSSSDKSTTTKTSTSTTATSSAPGPTTGGTSIPPEPEASQDRAAGTPVDVADYQQADMPDFVGFESPSGNVKCNIGKGTAEFPAFARCDAYRYSFTPPPRPADCDLEWGGSIGIDGFVCVGDATIPGPSLPYGSSITLGSITCASREDGMTCVDAAKSGKGFRIAKESYELF